MKRLYPAAHHAGHLRIFELMRDRMPENPSTLEELHRYYHRATHGCLAGAHEMVFDEIIWKEISRGYSAYVLHRYGPGGLDLVLLGQFFPEGRYYPDLLASNIAGPHLKAKILWWAGSILRPVGRLLEAIAFFEAAIPLMKESGDLYGEWGALAYLTRCYLIAGDVRRSIDQGARCVELVRNSTAHDNVRRIALGVYASTLRAGGRYDESLSAYREAASIPVQLREYEGVFALQELQFVELLLDLGMHDEARARIIDRAGLIVRSSISEQFANILLTSAEMDVDHEPSGRRDNLLEQLTLFQQSEAQGVTDYTVSVYIAFSRCFRKLGDLELARKLLDSATQVCEARSPIILIVDCLIERCYQQAAVGEFLHVRATAAQAEQLIEKMGYYAKRAALASIAEALSKSDFGG